MDSSTITAFQEVHGSDRRWAAHTHPFQNRALVFSSFPDSHVKGGVVTCIKHIHAWTSQLEIDKADLVPGRVLKLIIRFKDSFLVHYNVHNFELGPIGTAITLRDMDVELAAAARDPSKRLVVIAGDFNYLVPGEIPRSLSAPNLAKQYSLPIVNQRPYQQRWERTLGKAVEIVNPLDTHFSHKGALTSRIDRIYLSAMPSQLTTVLTQAKVLGDPAALFNRRISDHVPLLVSIAPKPRVEKDQLPLPPFLFKRPEFKAAMDELISHDSWDDWSPPSKLARLKVHIRTAAGLARDALFLKHGHTFEARLMTICPIARAVWTGNVSMARTLLDRSPLAQLYIGIDQDNVFVKDPIRFEQAYVTIRAASLQEKKDMAEAALRDSTSTAAQVRKAKAVKHAATRLDRLWSPFGKRLVLAGIVWRGDIVRAADHQLEVLAESWAPTFSHKPIADAVLPALGRFLEQYAKPFDWSASRPPCASDYAAFLARVPHSAPGCDGIPYAAFRATGTFAHGIFEEAGQWLCMGLSLGPAFNDALTCCAPKGDSPDDQAEVRREPDATRPLSLKNTDNKILCAVANARLRSTMTACASPIQRGFIPHRNFLDNIVDLDSHSRMLAVDPLAHLPVCALFDFGAAFPSVGHTWLFRVLRKLGLPDGLFNLACAMYDSVHAWGRAGCSPSDSYSW